MGKIEESKNMKEYAIWKDHKVIGYVYLTKDQANVLNSTKGIDLYFGFDKKTSPERY